MRSARRWTAGKTYNVSGVDFRVKPGIKVPGDLRLDVWSASEERWMPVKDELAFFLVDFLTENEQHIKQYKSWWKQNGDTYFMRACIEAVRTGWQTAAEKVRRQRGAA